jgi:hypothetical protein
MIYTFNILGARLKPVIMFGFILLLTVSLILGFVVYWSQRSEINCEANFILFNEDVAIPVLVSYVFNQKSGVAVLNGYIYKNNQNVSHISRKVVFEYSKDNSDYLLTSQVVIKSSVDNTDIDVLGKSLPDFYKVPRSDFYLNIQKSKSNGWVFSTGSIPSFFCEKI